MSIWRSGFPLLAFAAAIAAAPPAAASGIGLDRVPYRVSIAGIGIGDLDLELQREAERYAIRAEGSYRVLFWSGEVEGQVEGRIDAAGPRPQSFRLSNQDEDPSITEIEFDPTAGPVRWERNPPAPAEWSEGRMQLRDEHLVGALDPISALASISLIPAPVEATALCERDIRIFTGFVVFDLVLDGVERESPSSVACQARYRPLSGHRAGSKSVSRMSAPDAIEVSFLAHPDGAWVAERIALPTSIGTLALTIED
ncbi:MAG: DUF3108 domain-containing protein [Pseudomonadota bacterium]